MILMCKIQCDDMLDCNMVKVIFCGYGGERSIRIGTDVVFVTILCWKNHEGVFDDIILPTNIVHNDVIRYLTIRLGYWR